MTRVHPSQRETDLRPETFSVAPVTGETEWEALASGHPMGNIFCSWGWGTYKERTGWKVERLRIDDARGRPFGICSVSTRRKLGQRLFHVQGGPLILSSDDDKLAHTMLETLVAHLRPGRLDLVVLSPYHFRSPALLLGMLSFGFCPLVTRADHTLMLDTSRGVGPIRDGLGSRFKRGLKPGKGAPLEATFPDTPEARMTAMQRMAPIYDRLALRKGFEARTSVLDLAPIAARDPRFVVLEIRQGEEVVASCLSHVAGDLMVYMVAATTEAGLRSNAGYFALWSMVGRAVEMGIRRFDTGGVDPYGSPGVFRFKRGLAQDARQSEPVWLWSRSRLLGNALRSYMTWS